MSGFDVEGHTHLQSLPLSREDLSRRVWQFGPLGAGPYARHVRLLPDGRIAGQLGDNESFWRLAKNGLVFLDAAERRSTVFERTYVNAQGRLALVGRFAAPGGQEHLLREIEPLGELAETADGVDLIWRRRRAPRPNLVILRADEQSLHVSWPLDMAEEDRSWDLCVSFYGADENFVADPWSEYRVLQNKQRKFDALHSLLHEASPLWGYDFIALPDDDLLLSWRDWNELFAICREHRLELAQPALSPAGHVAHPITRRSERHLLRYVSFVDLTAPIFSRAALRACVPTFKGAVSGFGLDNTWPKLIGEPRDRIAVIDKVAVVHTDRQGPTLDFGQAMDEGNRLQMAYDAPSRVLEYGGLLLEPVNRKDPP